MGAAVNDEPKRFVLRVLDQAWWTRVCCVSGSLDIP
jgi:hypothetical protein